MECNDLGYIYSSVRLFFKFSDFTLGCHFVPFFKKVTSTDKYVKIMPKPQLFVVENSPGTFLLRNYDSAMCINLGNGPF